ncbi:hypothetical protein [Corynebacterium guangdongense]|uniref:Uncharacterized protein n=1 Tax=Corynebacterium guangdongense TaxID=1783348 RepID=A0ABU1ZX73_9CORY|nr:hypothetical protein [Corynebacterium guangdongense]MDR7329520.1 hypothetical protein [Corynebacterium guangdongense]WJZ18085.1 hypothetical protein CGUA_07615 [Corynebacterium guangdongense]
MDTRTDSAPLIVMSASPAQVRDLAPAEDASRELARRTGELVARLGAGGRPIELVASRDERWRTGQVGSFRAWGAPQVTVGQGHHLPELVARHVLGGREITSVRDRIGEINPEALTIVAVDGSAGMTDRAPLALLEGAGDAHRALLGLLAGAGLCLNHAELDDAGVIEPRLWLELAALPVRRANLEYHDTHLGVGRYLAAWCVGPAQ